jgi:hypothetical protein
VNDAPAGASEQESSKMLATAGPSQPRSILQIAVAVVLIGLVVVLMGRSNNMQPVPD